MISQTGYPSVDKPWLKYYERALDDLDIPKCSAYHLLYQNNKDYMNDVALIYFNRKIKFKELFDKIHKTAASLKELGIGKGDVVTLQVLNMPQVVELFYAISYIGAVANLIYASASWKETNEILHRTESKMYITIDFLWTKQQCAVEGTQVKYILLLGTGEEADGLTKTIIKIKSNAIKDDRCLSWKKFLEIGKEMPDEINESELPVAMVYTGGTTGKSKAVVLANRSMNALVYQYAYTYASLQRGETFLNTLPPFIAFGIVVTLHMPLCLGIRNALVTDPAPENAGKYFCKYQPDYYVNGSAGIDSIMNHKKIKKMNLEFVKVLASGGETLPHAFEEKVNKFLREHKAGTILSIGYGMTEVAATAVTSTPEVHKTGTVGIPLPGTIVKIVEPDTMKELSYEQDGEICFCTPTMMLGYYKNKEETDNIIRCHADGKRWIHSGDIGHISEDGFLTVSGRIKRVIVTWGENAYHKVFPRLIEELFAELEGINAVTVVGRKTTDVFHELIAFVVLNETYGEEEMLKVLKKTAEEKLDTWEQPVEYRFMERLPKTAIGKVDYRKLETMV